MIIRYLQLTLLISAVTGIWWYGHHKYGLGVSDTELRLENEYLKKLSEMKTKNKKLIAEMTRKQEEYYNGLLEQQKQATEYERSLRNRTKRLYVRTKEMCVSRPKSVSKDEPHTKVPAKEGKTALPADIAERLARRRAEADRLVLKYNACVDYIKQNYAHVNGIHK